MTRSEVFLRERSISQRELMVDLPESYARPYDLSYYDNERDSIHSMPVGSRVGTRSSSRST
jgi:hypothetical protein